MSATVRINLLPHREQKRAARQRQFISIAISLESRIGRLFHRLVGEEAHATSNIRSIPAES